MKITHWLVNQPAAADNSGEATQSPGPTDMQPAPHLARTPAGANWRPGRQDAPEGDARQLGPDALRRLRDEVVRRHLLGQGRREICDGCALSYTGVRKIIQLYERGGVDAMQPKLRGRRAGDKRRLTPAQEQRIRHAILEGSPRQQNMSDDVWRRDAVLRLIRRDFGMALPTRTMDHYLLRWGFKPDTKVFANARREPGYPNVMARAQARGGVVQWVHLVQINRAMPAPASGTRESPDRVPVLFSRNNRGQACWLNMASTLDPGPLASFCDQLLAGSSNRLILIVDLPEPALRLALQAWLALHQSAVECHYLPELEVCPPSAS